MACRISALQRTDSAPQTTRRSYPERFHSHFGFCLKYLKSGGAWSFRAGMSSCIRAVAKFTHPHTSPLSDRLRPRGRCHLSQRFFHPGFLYW